jgi:hypothetical protein
VSRRLEGFYDTMRDVVFIDLLRHFACRRIVHRPFTSFLMRHIVWRGFTTSSNTSRSSTLYVILQVVTPFIDLLRHFACRRIVHRPLVTSWCRSEGVKTRYMPGQGTITIRNKTKQQNNKTEKEEKKKPKSINFVNPSS